MKRIDPDRVNAAMTVLREGGTMAEAKAAAKGVSRSTLSRYMKKLIGPRGRRLPPRMTPERSHRAHALKEAKRAGCSVEEVLRHWAQDKAWCARCGAWLKRDDHCPSDCVRAYWRSRGLCGCCGKPPRPGLKTCEKQAQKSAAYQRAKTERKRAAERGTPP